MKRLKYLIVPLMLFSLVLIGGMCEKESSRRSRDKDEEEEQEQEEKKEENVYTYKNTQYGFEVKYPKDWELGEEVNEGGEFSIMIYSPLENSNDASRENVVIAVTPEPSYDFDSTIDTYIEEIKLSGTFLSSVKKTISGHPAYEINYLINSNGSSVKLSHYMINSEEGLWYQIAYISLEDTYSKFFNDFQIILNSFVIY